MSILISDMEIPQSCYMCDMLELSGAVGCKHAYDTRNTEWGRALNCPLIDFPDQMNDRKEFRQFLNDKAWEIVNKRGSETTREEIRGRWLEVEETLEYGDNYSVLASGYKCSECGTKMGRQWKYCPNCGARMDTEEV